MATTIRWIDNSSVEQGHRIYKSDTYFTKDNLPPMLVELGPDVEEYVDEDGEDGQNWYIVSAFIAGYEAFSEPFIGGLSTAFIHDVFGDGSAVATYRFDGDATDLGGNYDGAWSGTEQYDDGVIGQAASFDGENYIDISFQGDVTSMAVSIWVNLNKEDITGIYGFDLMHEHTQGYGDLTVYDTPTGSGGFKAYRNYLSGNVSIGEWFHLVHSIDDTHAKIYINGVDVTPNPTTGSYTGPFGRGYIGQNGRGSQFFDGLIDQFRIFNRSLTEEEVQALYQEGAVFL